VSTLAEIERAIEALPPAEVAVLTMWLESRRAEQRANDWPQGYFERTAGSFAGEPLERPTQGTAEQRANW
jgi:hypothetical protein